jgi:hypothetical protein
VNVLSKTLDDLGRWYVAIPPFLIVAFLAALFFVTGAGLARLEEAGENLQASAAREHGIDELQNSLWSALSSERGFLLTGDSSFLSRYEKARDDIGPKFDDLRSAYSATDADSAAMRNLHARRGGLHEGQRWHRHGSRHPRAAGAVAPEAGR